MRLLPILILAAACRGKADDDTTTDGTIDPATDADGDGYTDDDCDDEDALVNPGAEESCDGIDNNCDGAVDEGVASVFYADGDGDGFGNDSLSSEACAAPEGYTDDGTDCDDGDADSFPGAPERCDGADNDCDGDIDEEVLAVWYADADEDGYGDADAALETCDPPSSYVADSTDCDDTAAEAYPGGAEVCDELDNDCDGTVDEDVTEVFYQDADDDGYGIPGATTDACTRPTGYADEAGDCDDTSAAISPVAAEICNGVDDDCDGTTDEDDAVDAATWYADRDRDGYGNPDDSDVSCDQPSGYVSDSTDCDDSTADANPGAPEVCDSIDNDCDGEADEDSASDASTWYADSDGDGYGSTSSTTACDQPAGFSATGGDCNDSASAANPGAPEVCDEIDNDCDGDTDEDVTTTWFLDYDSDGYGDASRAAEACSEPSGYTSDDTDCDDTDSSANPGASEVCDEVDNDCDGDTDEGLTSSFFLDYDGDGYGDASRTAEACSAPSGYTSDSADCDDTDDQVSPDAEETCDGVDNDCDGDIDEDAADVEAYYADVDGDGYGDADDTVDACSAPSGYTSDDADCDDTDSEVNPAADEVCDGADNDCDGDIDDDDDDAIEACSDGESCLDIYTSGTTADGYYLIDAGGADPFEVYCNMTDNGGGWTLAASISSSNNNHLSTGAVDSDGDGVVDDDGAGDKLSDTAIDALWTDRVWVEISSGSGDIHCELSNQPSGYDTWSTTGSFTCGYSFSSTTQQSYAEGGAGPTVWKNYDYRAYDNPYSGCYGAAATYVPSGAGGCGTHPSRSGALWVR